MIIKIYDTIAKTSDELLKMGDYQTVATALFETAIRIIGANAPSLNDELAEYEKLRQSLDRLLPKNDTTV